MKLMYRFTLAVTLSVTSLLAQSKLSPIDKFRQMEEILPTPNEYRTASGAPGHKYWQQKVDYKIKVEIDDVNQRLTGAETITYHNNSPDTLMYLWLQLDQNIWEPGSDAMTTRTAPDFKQFPYRTAAGLLRDPFPGGYKIDSVTDTSGGKLPHTVVKTMMRVDLKDPLLPGGKFVFNVAWNYNITNSKWLPGRTGYEHFPKDGNYLYALAQWFPRLAAYYDVYGWQHKQFLGQGEFTLEFGDYQVDITVPDDHIVASTGVLQNPRQVLSATHLQRLETAKKAIRPVMIVTEAEAIANEKHKPTGKKTWTFHAQNVRDFAFASSRKFIWDAQLHTADGHNTWAMSYYPKEGNPLWERYSTQAVVHTLNTYSRYSFLYPYPIAISVNGVVNGGMEYPMICFNGPRPLEDKTYSSRTKYGLISVVIHEVGHNYFPMVVNSDERQWTWLDEGINSFLQYLSEQEWQSDYPSRRGEPRGITEYMTSNIQEPIMTNSETIINLGSNAYHKAEVGLNILRETILGRELFDYAFREYSRRWKFKRPTPSDFFRTMEDATGVDLDWFWRGWFYTTEHTDIALDSVKLYSLDTKNPDLEKPVKKKLKDEEPVSISEQRNKGLKLRIDDYPELKDFYNKFDEYAVTERDRAEYKKFLDGLEADEKAALTPGFNFYVMDLKNLGGLVMPVILQIEYTDGTSELQRIPAEIWRKNNVQVSKLHVTRKEIKQITVDPFLETADTDLSNNHFPRKPVKSPFQLFKEKIDKNPMQLEKDPKGEAPATSPAAGQQ
jgi:hypothetical protein